MVKPKSNSEVDLSTRIRDILVWQQGGRRAPHKPLLLLIALGKAYNGAERLIPYVDTAKQLNDLLAEFGVARAGSNQKPEEPFKRLPNDDLWELRDAQGTVLGYRPDLKIGDLKRGVVGGLLSNDYEQLVRNPNQNLQLAMQILGAHFPESYHKDILRRVDLPEDLLVSNQALEGVFKKRDPTFRNKVLRAYARECAVCGSGVLVANSLFDLEAAHIMWHSAGGPDVINNGLALCIYHHRAFDRGVIGVKQVHADFVIEVSEELHGHGPNRDTLLKFDGENLRTPKKRDYRPSAQFLDWHRDEVFRR